MTDPRVTVKDLKIGATTDSGRDVEIIRGVSFDIAPGEIIALIGESGSGKTTIALSLGARKMRKTTPMTSRSSAAFTRASRSEAPQTAAQTALIRRFLMRFTAWSMSSASPNW